MPVSVCLIEDDASIRNMMADLILASEECELLGTFGTAEEFIRLADRLRPDVVLTDIQLPGRSGIECIRELKLKYPNMQFVVCTVFEDNDKIYDALCAGATGYLLKSSDAGNIVNSITGVIRGESPMSGTIARKVIASFQHRHRSEEYTKLLSERGRTILEYLAKGYRYKEIAAELGISTETVRTHIRNIYDKLQVTSRTEALNKIYGQ